LKYILGLDDKQHGKEINSGTKKTTKKQQASENFKKQQASASEPLLPNLVKNTVPKKKKFKKIKNKINGECDENSVGSSQNGEPKKKK
jgi:hypothetical protein